MVPEPINSPQRQIRECIQNGLKKHSHTSEFRNHAWFFNIFMAEKRCICFDPSSPDCQEHGLKSISAFMLWNYPSKVINKVLVRTKGKLSTLEKAALIREHKEFVRSAINHFVRFVEELNLTIGGERYLILKIHDPTEPALVRMITDDSQQEYNDRSAIDLAREFNAMKGHKQIERTMENSKRLSQDFRCDPVLLVQLKATIDAKRLD